MEGGLACFSLRGDQTATFGYYQLRPEEYAREKPFEILINLPAVTKARSGFRRSNLKFEDRLCQVHDVRGKEHEFELCKHGVCWRRWNDAAISDVQSMMRKGNRAVEEEYLPQVEAFLRRTLAEIEGPRVDIVRIFDYRLRLSQHEDEWRKRSIDLNNGLDPITPVTHPHIDQSFEGAIRRVRKHMGARAPELLTRRFRIINVWRPLKTVRSWPLAVCDSQTVPHSDLIPADSVRRRFVGETYYAVHNPSHRWLYLSEQEPNEVTLLKIYDSDPNAEARYCLHSSFQPVGSEVWERRESIEVRALVFDHQGSA